MKGESGSEDSIACVGTDLSPVACSALEGFHTTACSWDRRARRCHVVVATFAKSSQIKSAAEETCCRLLVTDRKYSFAWELGYKLAHKSAQAMICSVAHITSLDFPS